MAGRSKQVAVQVHDAAHSRRSSPAVQAQRLEPAALATAWGGAVTQRRVFSVRTVRCIRTRTGAGKLSRVQRSAAATSAGSRR